MMQSRNPGANSSIRASIRDIWVFRFLEQSNQVFHQRRKRRAGRVNAHLLVLFLFLVLHEQVFGDAKVVAFYRFDFSRYFRESEIVVVNRRDRRTFGVSILLEEFRQSVLYFCRNFGNVLGTGTPIR
jgi:hypothetical protein